MIELTAVAGVADIFVDFTLSCRLIMKPISSVHASDLPKTSTCEGVSIVFVGTTNLWLLKSKDDLARVDVDGVAT
jgi:hypothetical protein